MKQEPWDVVIVGAGPAGSSAAFDLSAAGLRVLLLDKKTFPRVKPCAGGLTIKTLARLRFSVAPVVRWVSDQLVLGFGAGRRQSRLTAPGAICALTVRSELDAFCLERAVAQGATFRVLRGFSAIEESPEHVDLIDRNGERIRGRFLLGADGANSQVRRLTQTFEPGSQAFALEASVPLAQLGSRPIFTVDFGAVRDGYGWLFPKDDHVNVGLYTARPDRVEVDRAKLQAYAKDRLGTQALEQVIGAAMGTGGEAYRPNRERIFLIGDAAGFCEPLFGEGIYNAVVSGQQAARALIFACREGRSARQAFIQEMQEVQRDVRNCAQVSRPFYRWLPGAYELLRRPPVSTALLRGFAAGRTFTQIEHDLLFWKATRHAPVIPTTLHEYRQGLEMARAPNDPSGVAPMPPSHDGSFVGPRVG